MGVSKNTAPLRVVLVDDHKTSLMVIEHQLKNKNVVYNSFTNPLQALEYLKNHECDLVITDYEMPEINGFSLTRSIKKIPTCKPYIILSTGNITDQDFILKGLNYGVDRYLPKPIDYLELDLIVASLQKITLQTAIH